MLLYHVTPKSNRNAILVEGVDPAKSEGKLKRSWYVGQSHLTWAIAHVAARRLLYINDLIVFAVNARMCDLKQSSWAGVYTSRMILSVVAVQEAEDMLNSPIENE